MFRDPTKLKVFTLADEIALEVFRLAGGFPAEDRSGLDALLRRAALAVPLRIMEGCSRGGDEAFLQGLSAAAEAAADGRYITGLAEHLGLLAPLIAKQTQERFNHLTMALYGLRKAASKPRERAVEAAEP
jgi:four helix bundle protein